MVTNGVVKTRLAKDIDPMTVTKEQAIEIIANAPPPKPRAKPKTAAEKEAEAKKAPAKKKTTTRKKPAAKKAPAKKTAAKAADSHNSDNPPAES